MTAEELQERDRGRGPAGLTDRRGDPFRVLIVGGGVAALEAVLALRESVGPRAEVTLLAPNDHLSYRPLAALEPFGIDGSSNVPMDRLASDLCFDHVRDLLARVDPDRSLVVTIEGAELAYDALLIAIGARAETVIPGAITYRGPESAGDLRALLDSLRSGSVKRLAFAVPPAARWSLPLYELAVLTARHARRGGASAELVVATGEQRPLELFGETPSEGVLQLLAVEGIELRTSAAPAAARDGALKLADGEAIPADAVVALPRLVGLPIPGVPQGPSGFVATDGAMRVEELDRVWAAGDITWFPIKQGGLAAQQADVAASSIANLLDPEAEVRRFAPVLRGALLTGWAPYYLRAPLDAPSRGEGGTPTPLWWPPSKVAGRLLAPYLAAVDGIDVPQAPLEDLHPHAGEREEEDHLDALELALTAADLDARGRDYASALRWLDVAERLNLTLPDSYAHKRDRWSVQKAMQMSPR